jgi:hypothetical protein
MLKALAALAALTFGASITFAATLTGTFTYISGTTVATINPSASAQTVVLKVGTTNESFTDVIVTGAIGSPITAGTPFEILEKGSQPFAATFAADTDLLVGPTDLSGILGRRSVPITTTGVLSDSVGFPIGEFDVNILNFFYPAFTVGTVEFKNGMITTFSSEVKSYSIEIPTSTTTATLGTALFPTTQDPVESFSFLAVGNGGWTVTGSGASTAISSTERALYLTGSLAGTPTFFTSVTLSITASASGL